MGYTRRGEEEGLLAETAPERPFALHHFGNRLLQAAKRIGKRTSRRSPPRAVVVEQVR
jgi:hypothetical protein